MTGFYFLWNRIVFEWPNGTASMIPSDDLIREATIPQELNPDFAAGILREYEISDKRKIIEIIEKNSSNFWDEMCNELINSDIYDPKIYAFFSLQKHRTKQQNPMKSMSVFICYSNMVVSNLSRVPVDQTFVDYCELIGESYIIMNYVKKLISWCYDVFPQPLNYIYSVDNEYKERELVLGGFAKDLCNGGSDFDEIPPILDDVKPYLHGKVETERRLSIRFEERHEFIKSIENRDRTFAIEIDYDVPQLSEFHASKIDKNYSDVTKKKAIKPAKNRLIILPRDNVIPPLLQCQFCYEYRLGENLTRRPSIVPWHCQSQDCKKAYKRWQRDLGRKGLTLKKLRESGF
jgi:hypothetical protein